MSFGGPLFEFVEALQNGDIPAAIIAVLSAAIVLLLAFPLHELGHALAADRFGDDTPRLAGRITLNPFKQLNLLGSALFLLFGFGWASVPVNSANFRGNWRLKEVLVALAGPAMNLLLAIIFALIVRGMTVADASGPVADIIGRVAFYGVLINVFLAVFNLLPIPPLDGSRVILAYASQGVRETVMMFGQYGFFIIMLLNQAGILDRLINPPISALLRLLVL
jgi:Zn-dependent protease